MEQGMIAQLFIYYRNKTKPIPLQFAFYEIEKQQNKGCLSANKTFIFLQPCGFFCASQPSMWHILSFLFIMLFLANSKLGKQYTFDRDIIPKLSNVKYKYSL